MIAALSAVELAAILVGVVSIFATVLLCVVSYVVIRTMLALREAVDGLVEDTEPVLVDLRDTVGVANKELVRADGLLDVTESISTSVDQASRVAYLALSNPVIKTMAFASGAGRAARKLRKTNGK